MSNSKPMEELQARIALARARRNLLHDLGSQDAYLTAVYYVRVLERRLAQWVTHPSSL